MKRLLTLGAASLIGILPLMTPSVASARGRGGFFFGLNVGGFGFGFNDSFYGRRSYFAPAFSYSYCSPAPVYVAPPVVYSAPPPVTYYAPTYSAPVYAPPVYSAPAPRCYYYYTAPPQTYSGGYYYYYGH